MTIALGAQAVSMLAASGMSQTGISALTAAAQQSLYLAGLLNAAAQNGITIEIGKLGGGTAYGLDAAHPNAIVIDPTWVPGSGASNYDATSPSIFATTIAHEAAHAVLRDGIPVFRSNTPPDRAATIGGDAEGVALTAEYVVGVQLGLGTTATGYMHSDQG